MESNDSPEIPDRGETSDEPGLPSGRWRSHCIVKKKPKRSRIQNQHSGTFCKTYSLFPIRNMNTTKLEKGKRWLQLENPNWLTQCSRYYPSDHISVLWTLQFNLTVLIHTHVCMYIMYINISNTSWQRTRSVVVSKLLIRFVLLFITLHKNNR